MHLSGELRPASGAVEPPPSAAAVSAAEGERSPSSARLVARYLALRLGRGLVVMFGALMLSFVLVNLGGNSLEARSGGLLTPEQLSALAKQLGYDKPVLARLWTYVGQALQGNFGRSYRFNESSMSIVLHALPNTLVLVFGALTVGLLIGVPAAIASATRGGTRADRSLRGGIVVLQGLPDFWAGLMLVLVFAVGLHWAPAVGFGSPDAAILPIIALSLPWIPVVFRLLRGNLLDVMQRDFVAALRIKGLPDRQIVRRHALRNALPGFATFLALQTGYLLGGTILVEVVFGWPGMGSAMVSAAEAQDLGIVQAAVVVLAFCYVGLSLMADLVVLYIDPRVRTGRL